MKPPKLFFVAIVAMAPMSIRAADPPGEKPAPVPGAAFVQKYCLSCHGAEKKRGELDLSGFPVPQRRGECRQFDAQSRAQIDRRVAGRLFRCLRPQLQRVARPTALETVEHVLILIRTEATTRPTRAAVQQTRSAML